MFDVYASRGSHVHGTSQPDRHQYTYFDKPILHGLSWEIQAGQKIGLVGANGGGKSTLLKLILGQLIPDAGAIFRSKS